MSNIAGIILAGGRSSRMGVNKALLSYNGAPLIEHMMGLLSKAGLSDIYISGEVEGYEAIPDSQKFNGPAHAIMDVMAWLNFVASDCKPHVSAKNDNRYKDYDGALFVPVDMPLLTPEILQSLVNNDCSAYFENRPLPIYITRTPRFNIGEGRLEGKLEVEVEEISSVNAKALALPVELEVGGNPASHIRSVKDIISSVNAKALDLPIEFEGFMRNINTPEDWAAIS